MSLSQLKDREMFCRFVLCSFSENLAVTWFSWWIMPEKTGYAIEKFDDDIERVLQENASCFIRIWNLTTMYMEIPSAISITHAQAIQTGWWILHHGHPGWSPRLGHPSFTGPSESQFCDFFFWILVYTFIFLLWELNMKSSWVAIWTATQDRC